MTGSRPELLERYHALPVPTTKDEPWRFTDLRGFDPDAWTATSDASVDTGSLVELDAAGLARHFRLWWHSVAL